MFDFTSSKLLILGIVALLVIGPKELPGLLRTLGKYMGIIRKHANEFRAQFDEAMRDSELEALKKEVETIGKDTEATIRSAEQTVQSEVDAARASVDTAMDDPATSSRPTPTRPGFRHACVSPCCRWASGGGAGGALPRRSNGGRPLSARASSLAVEKAGQPAHVPDKTGVRSVQETVNREGHDEVEASKAPLIDHLIELRAG